MTLAGQRRAGHEEHLLALDPLGEVLWVTPLGATGTTRDLAVVGDRVLSTREFFPPNQFVETVLDELTLDGRPSRSAVIGCGGAAVMGSRPGSNQVALALGSAIVDLGGGLRSGAGTTLDLFAGVVTVQ